MNVILKQIIDKISSYNIFNNLYPGILLCYLLKFMFDINILSDNWFENLILFYFIGMVISKNHYYNFRLTRIMKKPAMKFL